MPNENEGIIARLVAAVLGDDRAQKALAALRIHPPLAAEKGDQVSRAAAAMALNIVLLDDVLARVPAGAAYVAAAVAKGERISFDHGALRTIRFADGPTGELPAGYEAFGRLLEPLGYRVADLYPLPRLKMTGRAYCHIDWPEEVPQFFVSELNVGEFDDAFAQAAHRVFDSSRDPLTDETKGVLAQFSESGHAPFDRVALELPVLARAFGCHHDPVHVADYETLLAQSAEAAWIATEGNAFNHATDRVPDVEALAERLKSEGVAMKDEVECSANGRIRQTATRADQVERTMVGANGERVQRMVPGSFHEFITRARDPETGRLDLGFDAGNATGIFAMTRAA